ncbi:MAG TPA: RidA family protein [Kofleriaceae bacterium]|nr:RidA family protein [Kofleriaceae bacterium]
MKVVHPAGFPPARGYSNGISAHGRTLHVAGQVAWEADGSVASQELIPQFSRALDNVLAVVRAGGGEPHHIVSMTIYVTDMAAYRAAAGGGLGAAWRERMGKHYPAMALVGVTALVDPRAVVEIQAVAVIEEEGP